MAGNDDYCPMTELKHDECDHCRHKDRQIVERDPVMRPKAQSDFVVAEFMGICHVCQEDIIPGDHIAVVEEVKNQAGEVVRKYWGHYGCTQ